MVAMAATTLLTSDQFLAMPEEFDQHGNRIKDELIGGEVVKMPPASSITRPDQESNPCSC